MDRLLTLLLSLILAGGGAWALASSDVSFTVPAPIRWVLPDGLKHFSTPGAQRDDALTEARKANDATATCQRNITAQNAAIAQLGRDSAAKLAAATKAQADARAVSESYRQASVALNAYRPKGSDLCARFEDADGAVVRSLQP